MTDQSPHSRELPLSEPTFLILLSMLRSPRHGYAIMKDVNLLSQGRIELGTGTLYGALKRMLENQWIEPAELPDEEQDGRERKTYRLTTHGQELLKAELARLQSLIQAVRLRVSGEI